MLWPIRLTQVLLFPAGREGLVEARSIDLEIQAPVGLWAFHSTPPTFTPIVATLRLTHTPDLYELERLTKD